LYRTKRNGTRDYEKYAQLALDDEVTSVPLEANENNNK
jgi:cbb3-type cytochrome c oxidase CcoQ subunit